jgi:hypothetical protein
MLNSLCLVNCVYHVALNVNSNVSEERADSIFRTEAYRRTYWLICAGCKQNYNSDQEIAIENSLKKGYTVSQPKTLQFRR